MPSDIDLFENHRPLMFSIAYRMLGSVMDAEDIVQEAYLRYQTLNPASIQNPAAFLSTMITRLCLNHLNSAQVQREQYIGPWLPEALQTPTESDPANLLISHESISMAFLVLLQQLSPSERAVFLLRHVFDYPYAEIALILDKEEAACRQLFSRAQKHIEENRPRFPYSRTEHQKIMASFIQAVSEGDLTTLTDLLTETAMLTSDGGGKASAITRPLYGPIPIAKFFLGLYRHTPPDFSIKIADFNHKPAILLYTGATLTTLIHLEIGNGHIQAFYITRNPDKLRLLHTP